INAATMAATLHRSFSRRIVFASDLVLFVALRINWRQPSCPASRARAGDFVRWHNQGPTRLPNQAETPHPAGRWWCVHAPNLLSALAPARRAPILPAVPRRTGDGVLDEDLISVRTRSPRGHSYIVLMGGALYIPEATPAAEISPNFRPQIGHI